MNKRMYFLVMYNLSPIQKGIQAGHAALEYAYKYADSELYKDFFLNHKTFIVLDGGGSNQMHDHLETLKLMRHPHAEFREPDLNSSISAICFILTEDFYSKEGKENTFLGQWLSQFHLAR